MREEKEMIRNNGVELEVFIGKHNHSHEKKKKKKRLSLKRLDMEVKSKPSRFFFSRDRTLT